MVIAVVAFAEFTTPPPKTTIPSAAPNAAPCETPSEDAEASGFRRTHCITAPAAASAEPTRIAVTARGRRIFMIAVRCIFSPPPVRTAKISGREIGMEPMPSEYSAAASVTISAATSAMRLRRRYWL